MVEKVMVENKRMLDDKKSQLINIFGENNISDDFESLASYSSDYSLSPTLIPHYIVRPETASKVQRLILWANETGTPLVPVSSGPPHFNGDTVPTAPGAVIIDLSRMNKIINIDTRNRIVIVEPGVTYSQLLPELTKNGLRLSTPLAPRGNKSVVASLIEREPTLTPRFNYSLPEPLRTVEIIWGNGETILTGDAGTYPTLEKNWQMGLAQAGTAGPAQTDFLRFVSAAQGSMGIVTWASIKCQILPKVQELFFIPAKSLNDLIDCAYKLLRLRFGDELLILNNTNLAYLIGKNKIKEQLPPWVLLISVSGRDLLPEEQMEVEITDIAETVQQYGLKMLQAIPGINSKQMLNVMLSVSPEPYWKIATKGSNQDIFFLTTLDKTGGFVKTMFKTASNLGYPGSDIGVYLQPLHQGTSCHCEFSLPYNLEDSAEKKRMYRMINHNTIAMLNQGAFFSRPYGVWADMVFNRDAGARSMLRMIKNIADPNNVMNPGKLCF